MAVPKVYIAGIPSRVNGSAVGGSGIRIGFSSILCCSSDYMGNLLGLDYTETYTMIGMIWDSFC